MSFALLAALAYGTGDFAAGLASRRLSAGPVTVFTQTIGLGGAGIAVVLVPGVGPSASALWWGAASGMGAALGVLTLYRGLSVASMSVVAPVCAVLTAVLPVVVGLAGGEHLSVLAVAAIGVAVVAIALVSRGEAQPSQDAAASTGMAGTGLLWGSLSGVGFAVLFIALDQAGTSSGAWPLLPSGAVSLILVLPFGLIGRPRHLGQIRPCAVPPAGGRDRRRRCQPALSDSYRIWPVVTGGRHHLALPRSHRRAGQDGAGRTVDPVTNLGPDRSSTSNSCDHPDVTCADEIRPSRRNLLPLPEVACT